MTGLTHSTPSLPIKLNDLSTLTPHGILLVDKPVGLTSHTIVAKARRILKTKKIGHSGTLDPFASGLLVLLVGEMVSLQSIFMGFSKDYLATFQFGVETDTLDPTGEIISNQPDFELPPNPDIQSLINEKFLNTIQQIPPRFSAIKVNGKRAYQLSRNHQSFTLASREVTIKEFKITSRSSQSIEAFISCSTGTYIRSLARDLAKELDTVAHASCLRRTRVGPFQIEDAVNLDELEQPDRLLSQANNLGIENQKNLKIKQNIITVDDLLDKKNSYSYFYKEIRDAFKGIKINLDEQELRLAKNGQFSFLNRHLQDGKYFLSYKHQTLMIIEKNSGKFKVCFNLLKLIDI